MMPSDDAAGRDAAELDQDTDRSYGTARPYRYLMDKRWKQILDRTRYLKNKDAYDISERTRDREGPGRTI